MLKVLAVVALVGLVCSAVADANGGGRAKSFFDFSVKSLDGKDVALSKYKGDVCLVVNVASY
jgi:Glutathione peroxidase